MPWIVIFPETTGRKNLPKYIPWGCFNVLYWNSMKYGINIAFKVNLIFQVEIKYHSMIILKRIQIVDQKPRNVNFVAKLAMTEEIFGNTLKTFIFLDLLYIIASSVVKVLMLRTTCTFTSLKHIETNNNKSFEHLILSVSFL